MLSIPSNLILYSAKLAIHKHLQNECFHPIKNTKYILCRWVSPERLLFWRNSLLERKVLSGLAVADCKLTAPVLLWGHISPALGHFRPRPH